MESLKIAVNERNSIIKKLKIENEDLRSMIDNQKQSKEDSGEKGNKTIYVKKFPFKEDRSEFNDEDLRLLF